MLEPVELSQRLWGALAGLAQGLPPRQPLVPTVRVVVNSGAVLEVFRAERVEATMEAWRVRGFTDDGSTTRLAVILGTQDGRAMVTERVSNDEDLAVVGGMVVEAESNTRSLSDLSEAIANAVRELMGEPPLQVELDDVDDVEPVDDDAPHGEPTDDA